MIKRIIRNNTKIFNNFGYLSILQIFNIALPLISYPYLIRILGSEVYGEVVFAQAIIVYFSLIINFGFNITGTKVVAENINNRNKLSEIVSSIYCIKFILFIVSLFLLILSLWFVAELREMWLLILFSFTATSSGLLLPQWYFQGIDKMKYITLLSVFSRILFTILIFFIVKNKTDFLLVPILSGIGITLSGFYALYILFIKEKLTFYIPKISTLIYYFKDSVPLFVSSASVQVYVNANRILVGSFLGMSEVAFYDLGEKVLRLIKIPVGMLGQAAFPTLSREKSINKINKVMAIGVFMTIFLIALVFIFSEEIVFILGGSSMLKAIDVLQILSISGVMIAFSQFLGTSRLIVFGFKKIFMQIIASSGLFFLFGFLFLFLLDLINMNSLAWLAVLVESWVTLLMLIIVYKKRILYEKV
jgi:PST family polysaccharide transporter